MLYLDAKHFPLEDGACLTDRRWASKVDIMKVDIWFPGKCWEIDLTGEIEIGAT